MSSCSGDETPAGESAPTASLTDADRALLLAMRSLGRSIPAGRRRKQAGRHRAGFPRWLPRPARPRMAPNTSRCSGS